MSERMSDERFALLDTFVWNEDGKWAIKFELWQALKAERAKVRELETENARLKEESTEQTEGWFESERKLVAAEAKNIESGEAIDHWHDVAEGWAFKVRELEAEVEHLRNERNEWSRRHGIVEARVKELEEDNTTLHNAVVDSKEAQKAAEAKVAGLAGMVKHLCRALKRTQHNSDFDPGPAINKAIGYLKRKDLLGSILRQAVLSDKGG